MSCQQGFAGSEKKSGVFEATARAWLIGWEVQAFTAFKAVSSEEMAIRFILELRFVKIDVILNWDAPKVEGCV